MAEEDARSDASFQSAGEDFDLPRASGDDDDDDDALPPGLEDEGEEAADRWNLRKDGNREQLEPIHTRLAVDREHIKVSKMFSYVLRHSAHKMDVGIRKDGYVRLRDITKLRNFKPYNLEELMAVVYFDEKERFTMVREFDGELLIRANQGHTMKVVESDMLLEVVVDPETVRDCVHGTYLVHWPFIKKQGISKVSRNHIHMANGMPEDGKIRGMRATAEMFLYVDVPRAMEDGVVFYRSKNDVILTQGINGWLPPKYFHKAVRIDYNTCDIEEMEFDVEAEIPTWAAELAPSGPGEQGTYLIKNLEALISNCKKRLSEINDFKAMQELGQELSEEELGKLGNHTEVYTELQSLEQRWRQHKGHRKENSHEKEARALDEAESGTIVRRKDRAVAPPWEKAGALESGDKKASEKEKAQWANIGKMRESASEKVKAPKEEDPWDKIGSMRSGNTPAASSDRAEGSWRAGGGKPAERPSPFEPADRAAGSWRAGGGESSRRSAAEEKDGPPRFFNSRAGAGTPAAAEEKKDGPPRFINTKTGAGTPGGGSWRDRMTAKTSETATPSGNDRPQLFGGEAGRAGDGDRPSWRKQPSAKEDESIGTPGGGSWRDRMTAKTSEDDRNGKQCAMNIMGGSGSMDGGGGGKGDKGGKGGKGGKARGPDMGGDFGGCMGGKMGGGGPGPAPMPGGGHYSGAMAGAPMPDPYGRQDPYGGFGGPPQGFGGPPQRGPGGPGGAFGGPDPYGPGGPYGGPDPYGAPMQMPPYGGGSQGMPYGGGGGGGFGKGGPQF